MNKKKILLSSFVMCLVVVGALGLSFGVWAPPLDKQPNNFIVLGTWAIPLVHGQGFEAIEIYENSTGSWEIIDTLEYDSVDTSFELEGGASIKLITYTWLNSTLVNAGSSAIGQRYQITNATIRLANDTLVYSSGNFTYSGVDTGIDPPLWMYDYEHVLNYAFDYGTSYIVNVSYFTYW